MTALVRLAARTHNIRVDTFAGHPGNTGVSTGEDDTDAHERKFHVFIALPNEITVRVRPLSDAVRPGNDPGRLVISTIRLTRIIMLIIRVGIGVPGIPVGIITPFVFAVTAVYGVQKIVESGRVRRIAVAGLEESHILRIRERDGVREIQV